MLIITRVNGLELSADRPADPHLDSTQPTTPRRWAVAAAIVLHACIIAWLLFGWNEAPHEVPAPIPVALVFEPPPPPPPPVPVPKPAPPPAVRRSGPDQRTVALPSSETRAPTPEAPPPPAAPKPTPAPLVTPAPAVETAPQAATIKAPPRRAVEHHAPRRKAAEARAPAKRPDEAAIGEKAENGDPYLNRLWAMIDRNRAKTTPIGASGLHLAGTSVFALILDRAGTLHALNLERSSGAVLLDDEARRMIVKAEPFPPLPPDYPSVARVVVTISLYPQ
ncbi:MAG TPA: TonB C-terminal domain-containing protein [Stellaceae bacterium]|nr:TonB C-terminal domain-containing protein [Stellaceae bacterium]